MITFDNLHQYHILIPITFIRLMQYSQHYIVTQQEIQHFREKGYVKLKGILTKEQLQPFRNIINQTVNRIAEGGDKQNRIDDYSQIFTQVTNLWKIQPQSQPFVFNKLFAHIAKQLLGVEGVRLYHDQALVKQPKAGKTPWHQDYFYWPIDSPNTVTMWMPMHNCPRQMGTMKFATKSHVTYSLKQMPISQESQQYFEDKIKENGLQIETFDLELGDATFHYGRTLHCAHSNGLAQKREAMTIIFFQDGAKAMRQDYMNEFRKVDLSVFCPGISHGQIINSELNPKLF